MARDPDITETIDRILASARRQPASPSDAPDEAQFLARMHIVQLLSNLDDEELRDLVFAYYAGRHTFDGCSGTSRLVLRTLSRSESIATLSGSIRELLRYLTAYKQEIGKLTYFEPAACVNENEIFGLRV
ncbi:MAG: hypothetical protein IPH07_18435 [Deltaproteobacteria bacterium]|nr:hypothetical protein [Deltaproteobacteria bacterium]MBK8715680.1 hypothetical protein [Deltaproteobacteria bacterium]